MAEFVRGYRGAEGGRQPIGALILEPEEMVALRALLGVTSPKQRRDLVAESGGDDGYPLALGVMARFGAPDPLSAVHDALNGALEEVR